MINFEDIWKKYPRKEGKIHAIKHYKTFIKTKKDKENIEKALDNYIKYIELRKLEYQYIKQGSTFFYQFEDWVDFDFSVLDINKEENEPKVLQKFKR